MDQIDQKPPLRLDAPIAQSEDLGKLFEALSKAQGEMKAAVMDKRNPHFGSKYASLNSCQEAYKGPLAKHGLSLTQQVFTLDQKYFMRTTLAHTSSQWISSTIALIVGSNNMQGLGSAITYGRRYALSGLLGLVTDEDDDGNAAVESQKKAKPVPIAKPTKPKNHAPQAPKPDPMPDYEGPVFDQNEPIPDFGEPDQPPIPTFNDPLDELLHLRNSKGLSNEEMSNSIYRVLGEQKRAKDLTPHELQRVIDYVRKFK